MPGDGRWLRDNAFLVAAVSLPAVIVVFFLLSAAVPRWLVDPPAYDLVLRAAEPYNQAGARIAVDYSVRDGRVEATVRPLPANAYPQAWVLFLFDHNTMNVREIPVDVPATLAENDPPRTIVVSALASRQVVAETTAPDGYEFTIRSNHGSGIVGEIFGMHRYDQTPTLVKNARVVRIPLPTVSQYVSPASLVGWLVDSRPH
jgi:hypothetical protein